MLGIKSHVAPLKKVNKENANFFSSALKKKIFQKISSALKKSKYLALKKEEFFVYFNISLFIVSLQRRPCGEFFPPK